VLCDCHQCTGALHDSHLSQDLQLQWSLYDFIRIVTYCFEAVRRQNGVSCLDSGMGGGIIFGSDVGLPVSARKESAPDTQSMRLCDHGKFSSNRRSLISFSKGNRVPLIENKPMGLALQYTLLSISHSTFTLRGEIQLRSNLEYTQDSRRHTCSLHCCSGVARYQRSSHI
jgi:hypothetical protein